MCRQRSHHASRHARSQETKPILLENLLVATDYSEASDTALLYGRALASEFGATLHVVNVVPRVMTISGIEGYMTGAGGLSQTIEQAARQQLDASITADDRRALRADAVLLSSDRPAVAVVEYAREAAVDLIVIGTDTGPDSSIY